MADRTTINTTKDAHQAASDVKDDYDESWTDVLRFYAEWREPIDERIAELMAGDAPNTSAEIDTQALAKEVSTQVTDDLSAQLPRKIAEELQ